MVLAILSGCSGITSPRLSVAEVVPGERSDDGLALKFVLNGENDNDVGLPLRTVQYRVELAGQEVFSGTRSPEATLRRLGVQQITLPAVVRLADHPGIASRGRVPYRINGTITYVAPGQIAEVLFDAGVRVPKTSFSASGEVDLGS
jgi:hypothetical protein